MISIKQLVDYLPQSKPIPYVIEDEQRNVYLEEPCGGNINPSTLLNFYMGRNSYYQSGQISPNVFIGRYCSIAHNVHVGASQHNMDHLTTGMTVWGETQIKSQDEYTVIGSDVWIGLNAIVMNGVKIGHGAVVGAGAVVTKDVPPYAIVTGVPAKVLRYRFDQETIQELLESKWWTYDPIEIGYLPKNDIKACIEYFRIKRG